MDKWKNDIEKYLSGKMTTTERHALEKKALNDPFLADALEGAETISADDFTSDLNELTQKIRGGGKNRWIWPMRIAASVVGIALVSTVVFYSVKDDESQIASTTKPTETTTKDEKKLGDTLLIAENKSADEDAKESKDQSRASTSSKDKTVTKERPKREELIALQNPKETKNETAGGSGVASAKPTSTSTVGPLKLSVDSGALSGLAGVSLASSSFKMDSIADPTEAEVADDVVTADPVVQPDFIKSESKAGTRSKRLLKESKPAATAPTQQPVITSEESRLSDAIKSTALNLVVTGQVRDQLGQPIPGVNIVVKGSSNGTVTNAEGKYTIELSDPNQSLVYSFVGFVAQEQPADKAKTGDLDVQLQEDITQLSEVVVTGYGSQKKDGEPIIRLAEPMGGRKAYDQYLEDKKVYPQQALDNKVAGKVIIEFTVTSTGSLIDFNVVRNLGYGCEEEVIRLVKEGPKWYPTYIDNEAVESLVRVKTRFDLPGKK